MFPGVYRACMNSGWGRYSFHRRDIHAGNRKAYTYGQLGDVMKESAKISLSLIRFRFAHRTTSFDFITMMFISMFQLVRHQKTVYLQV
jgi:hypothetical protein